MVFLAAAVFLGLGVPDAIDHLYRPRVLLMSVVPSSLLSLDARVDRIMAQTPLLGLSCIHFRSRAGLLVPATDSASLADGHDDLAERVRFHFRNHIYSPNFNSLFAEGGMPDHLDIPRMKRGKQGGFFWSCWVDCPASKMDFSNENYAPSELSSQEIQDSRAHDACTAVIEAMSQLDVIRRLQAAHSDVFSPATLDSSSALSAFRRYGKFMSPIGLEGLHMIGRNASTLRLYHSLGVKYATLTWNCHNAFADAAQVTVLEDSLSPEAARPAKPHWGGLSPLGTKMIHEMNRLGIIVSESLRKCRLSLTLLFRSTSRIPMRTQCTMSSREMPPNRFRDLWHPSSSPTRLPEPCVLTHEMSLITSSRL